jgi:pyruvate/2-oxoglutarate dehydrogenase complex dihydrolipoamide acyltransferase (E2) component
MVDFRLPELGEGIEEADVLKILVAEGDTVEVGQSLVEIETEKATVEVPSETDHDDPGWRGR